MKAALILAALALVNAPASANAKWTAMIFDVNGTLSISLQGSNAPFSLTLSCTGVDVGIVPSALVNVPPTLAFRIKAGDPALITVTMGDRFKREWPGIVAVNDSNATAVEAVAADVLSLVTIANPSDIAVAVDIDGGKYQAAFTLPSEHAVMSFHQFADACSTD